MFSNAHSDTFFVDQEPAGPAHAAPAPVAEQVIHAPIGGGGMRDVPLGTLIFRAGLLAKEQLEDALQEGMRTGKRLGEVLAERGLIKDSDLGRLLAGQKGFPYVEVATVSVDPEAVQMLPGNIARMQNALAFAFEDGVPVVAVADPTNELVMENVQRALGTELGFVVAAHGELAKRINEVYSAAAPEAQPVPADPAQAVVTAPAPALAPESVPATAPEPPAQVEHPEPAPAPTPMLTSMSPAEEREPEPEPLMVEPLVVAAAPAEVPTLHAETAHQPPLAPEPVAVPAPPAGQAPEPAQVAEHVELVVELPPAEPAIIDADPAALEEPAVTEEHPAAAAEEPVVMVAAEQPAGPAPEPASPVDPAPAPPEVQQEHTAQHNGTAPEVAPNHFVVLRLAQGDHLEIGGFPSKEEAESFARAVVGRIGRAEEQAEWPVFEGRFLRPQTIVSVDVVDEAKPE